MNKCNILYLQNIFVAFVQTDRRFIVYLLQKSIHKRQKKRMPHGVASFFN